MPSAPSSFIASSTRSSGEPGSSTLCKPDLYAGLQFGHPLPKPSRLALRYRVAMSETDLLVIAVASLVGSFVKSVTGMGYPLIAIPLLTLFLGIESAVVIIAVPNLVLNGLLNRGVREEHTRSRDLPVLLVTSILGAYLGTLVLVEAPEKPLLLGLALSVFIFVLQRLRNPELHLGTETTRRWAPVAGAFAGFSHGAVGVSGPIVAMWFHGYRLPKDTYVYCVTALFFVSGATQLVVLLLRGEFGHDEVVGSLVAMVATLSMIPIGTRMRSRIHGELFERLILVLLLFSGVSLVFRALD